METNHFWVVTDAERRCVLILQRIDDGATVVDA
jgi:hypothetical protein